MVALFYPKALGSLFFFACYDSQGQGGGILTRLHTGTRTQLHQKSAYNEVHQAKVTKIVSVAVKRANTQATPTAKHHRMSTQDEGIMVFALRRRELELLSTSILSML
jgi:hypothetical protein